MSTNRKFDPMFLSNEDSDSEIIEILKKWDNLFPEQPFEKEIRLANIFISNPPTDVPAASLSENEVIPASPSPQPHKPPRQPLPSVVKMTLRDGELRAAPPPKKKPWQANVISFDLSSPEENKGPLVFPSVPTHTPLVGVNWDYQPMDIEEKESASAPVPVPAPSQPWKDFSPPHARQPWKNFSSRFRISHSTTFSNTSPGSRKRPLDNDEEQKSAPKNS